MGIIVHSILWVMQGLCHQSWGEARNPERPTALSPYTRRVHVPDILYTLDLKCLYRDFNIEADLHAKCIPGLLIVTHILSNIH